MKTGLAFLAVVGSAVAAGAVPVPLPVNDGFESYGAGTAISSLGSQGWGASTAGFTVQTAVKQAGAQAAELSEPGTMSNAVISADNKVWVDFYMLPQFGGAPSLPTGATVAVRFFVDMNGIVNVATAAGWQQVATDVYNTPIPPLVSTSWSRFTIFHNYGAGLAALFVNGRLLRKDLPLLQSGAVNMNALTFIQHEGLSYVDSVSIAATYPATLSDDLDNNGVADVIQIHNDGALSSVRHSPLPLADTFEAYTAGKPLRELGYYGWGASHADVTVQAGTVYAGSRAAAIPFGMRATSNTVQAASVPVVWTDLRLKPVLGALPVAAASDKTTVRVAFTTNGYVAVESAAGWDTCVTALDGTAVPALAGQWTRISVALDYGREWAAVFQDGKLLRERLPFIGANATTYRFVKIANDDGAGTTYLDNLLVDATYPVDLTDDSDGDGRADAWEVHGFGATAGWPNGTMFIVR